MGWKLSVWTGEELPANAGRKSKNLILVSPVNLHQPLWEKKKLEKEINKLKK